MNKAKLEDVEYNQLDLESLGSWLTMPKKIPSIGVVYCPSYACHDASEGIYILA